MKRIATWLNLNKKQKEPTTLIVENAPAHSAEQIADNTAASAFNAHKALTKVRITNTNISGATKIQTSNLQLYVLDDFLSKEECEKIIEIAQAGWRRSLLYDDQGDKEFRTSSTCQIDRLNAPFIRDINMKIATTIGISPLYSDALQAQKYEVGQQYKPHVDYIPPYVDHYEMATKDVGNRTWTFMVYLNNVPKGGGTGFVNIDQVLYPKVGRAVIWNNLHEDGTPNVYSLHCGMPVEEGEKIIITKWFRERGEGEMFLP